MVLEWINVVNNVQLCRCSTNGIQRMSNVVVLSGCEEDSNTKCEEYLNTLCDEDLNITYDEDSNTQCDEDLFISLLKRLLINFKFSKYY